VSVNTNAIQIRHAHAGDAEMLARFAEQTFRTTFAADNTAADMDSYCASAFSLAHQTRELSDPAVVTLVAEDERGGYVAYAQVKDGGVPPPVQDDATLELVRFYVDGAHHGRGVATALMQRVYDVARERGATRLWLGVWERNARAIAFYRKMGFVDVGAHDFLLGADRQTDRIMARAVPP
jgi:GNAT superfamily N-acetyltransferase